VLDIPLLERRWLKYKLKRYLPYAVFAITIFIIPISIIVLIQHRAPSIQQSVKEKKTLIAPTNEVPMILEPSMQFVQSLPSTVPDVLSSNPSNVLTKAVIPQKSILPATIPQIKVSTPSTPIAPPVVHQSSLKKASSINRDTEVFNIHEIEERFQNNSNPHLGVYIARYHYDHGNYNESYNYALKTNSINNTMEESWLIFAKSMVKLGKIDEAKKTLQLYISQSNSDSARSLLASLEKETSK
jgi:hypothetical protein